MSNAISAPGSSLQSSNQSTFVERGAAIPFTTPSLAGARGRASARHKLDLLVPNPSGGRGIYIVPWNSLPTICSPTVHDRLLSARLAGLELLTPASVRQASLQVASEASAGRAAARQAQAAQAEQAKAALATNFGLLLKLVEQAEPTPEGVPAHQESLAALQRRAQRTITHLAPRLGADNAAIAAMLEDMAQVFEPIGLADRTRLARIPALVGAMRAMRQALPHLPVAGEDAASLLQPLAVATDLALTYVANTLADAHAKLDNLVELLFAWRADPSGMTAEISRSEWLLDGWERICRLWLNAATASDRRDAVEDILVMLPVMPKEGADWAGLPAEPDAALPPIRLAARHDDWRHGTSVQDVIARNEALLVSASARPI